VLFALATAKRGDPVLQHDVDLVPPAHGPSELPSLFPCSAPAELGIPSQTKSLSEFQWLASILGAICGAGSARVRSG
jgi:hypothetical protein